MLVEDRDELFVPLALDRLQDLFVLLVRHARVVGPRRKMRAQRRDLRHDARIGFGEVAVSTVGEKLLVKSAVEAQIGRFVSSSARLIHPGADLGETVDQARAVALQRKPQRGGFQRLPKFTNLHHFGRAQCEHERAGLRDDRDQTLHAQLRQRFTHRRFADAE